MVAALAVGGVLVLAMIAVSGYAAVILPGDARIPLHLGSPDHVVLVGKRAGLVMWPALGAVLFGVLGGVSASSLASGWVPGVRDVLMPAVMCVVLGFQVGALVLAAQDQGSERIPGALLGRLSRWVALTIACARCWYSREGRHEDRQQSGQGDAGSAAR